MTVGNLPQEIDSTKDQELCESTDTPRHVHCLSSSHFRNPQPVEWLTLSPKIYAVGVLLILAIGALALFTSEPERTPTVAAKNARESDGGRILRRRGVFPHLSVPDNVPAGEADFLDAHDEVLGVVVNGQARAYPVHAMAYHHIVNDTIRGAPVVVTYCTICASGIAFDPVVAGVRKTFQFEGIWQGSMLMSDLGTGSDWLHLTGECIQGKQKGNRLEPIAVRHVLWKEWVADHPTSDVMRVATTDTVYGDKSASRRGSEVMPDYFYPTIRDQSNRRDPMELVFGVSTDQTDKAYPIDELLRASDAMVMDMVGQTPVVVGVNKTSSSPFGYDRRLDGRVLLFGKTRDGMLEDRESGSVFNLSGMGIKGRYSGRQLKRLNSVQAKWYGWFASHTGTEVWTLGRGVERNSMGQLAR